MNEPKRMTRDVQNVVSRIDGISMRSPRRRDALREIYGDLEVVIIGSTDRGVEALDDAVSAFSEYV